MMGAGGCIGRCAQRFLVGNFPPCGQKNRYTKTTHLSLHTWFLGQYRLKFDATKCNPVSCYRYLCRFRFVEVQRIWLM
jgi:hypothetical protein